MKSVTIGITAGDINGIGPEVAVRAACGADWPPHVTRVLIGSADILLIHCEAFGWDAPEAWTTDTEPGSVCIWEPEGSPELTPQPGTIDPKASEAAHLWICAAVSACLQKKMQGMVTGPISKDGFQQAGVDVPGHTELIAQLCDTRRVAMLLTGGPLRVVLATRHIPLSNVPKAITAETIREATELLHQALPLLGVEHPRIAICGLNPHAGDGGALGREEIEVIAPTVAAMQQDGIPVEGPLAADTVFRQALEDSYNAVVAMYHDQGLAPLKMLAFDIGVNVTLGLPIVRTSPDHGTAFGIAAKGVANPYSMIEAIKTAVTLAEQPNPWAKP